LPSGPHRLTGCQRSPVPGRGWNEPHRENLNRKDARRTGPSLPALEPNNDGKALHLGQRSAAVLLSTIGKRRAVSSPRSKIWPSNGAASLSMKLRKVLPSPAVYPSEDVGRPGSKCRSAEGSGFISCRVGRRCLVSARCRIGLIVAPAVISDPAKAGCTRACP
jgi:hypothetical protein